MLTFNKYTIALNHLQEYLKCEVSRPTCISMNQCQEVDAFSLSPKYGEKILRRGSLLMNSSSCNYFSMNYLRWIDIEHAKHAKQSVFFVVVVVVVVDCGEPCTFDNFVNLTRENIPLDWAEECKEHTEVSIRMLKLTNKILLESIEHFHIYHSKDMGWEQ